MARIVVALGGNALGKNPAEQKAAVSNTASLIVDLVKNGHDLILTHGNGPQVGMIHLAFEISMTQEKNMAEMPFPECGAMSQGYIGYHLQNAFLEELKKKNVDKTIATIITQIVVDKNDAAFSNPTKPIGGFYTKDEAKKLEEEKEYTMIEDCGRGYRRVVPSPLPVDIVEKNIIKSLVDKKEIVITCGGGGIPVIREGSSLIGVPAVIDKDFAGEKLAEILNADLFVILTAVEKIALNFGTINEKWLSEVDVDTARKYCEEGHFAPGSMLPKVQAAIKFAKSKSGRKTIITSLEKAKEGLEGKSGTIIKK